VVLEEPKYTLLFVKREKTSILFFCSAKFFRGNMKLLPFYNAVREEILIFKFLINKLVYDTPTLNLGFR